jgi:hypothetical protein
VERAPGDNSGDLQPDADNAVSANMPANIRSKAVASGGLRKKPSIVKEHVAAQNTREKFSKQSMIENGAMPRRVNSEACEPIVAGARAEILTPAQLHFLV